MKAPLIVELACGVTTAAGIPAAGATARFYYPGTFTAAAGVFADDGVTPVSTSLTLDGAGRAFVRSAAPVRLVVQDSAGATVLDAEVVGGAADSCYVDNSLWNGGAPTSLQSVLTKIGTSLGADGLIKPGAASLGLGVGAWANGVHIDVTGENAGGLHPVVGDGVTDCTAGIQAAIALVEAQGGGIVYFPSGTYLFSADLVVSSGGVTLCGASAATTVLLNSNAAGNGITAVAVANISLRNLTIDEVNPCAGVAVNLDTCTDIDISDCIFKGYSFEINADDCDRGRITGCYFQGKAGTIAPIYLHGSTARFSVIACNTDSLGARFATCTGTGGQHSFAAINAPAVLPGVEIYVLGPYGVRVTTSPNVSIGAGSEYVTYDDYMAYGKHAPVAPGGTATPDTTGGRWQFEFAASGAGAITVAVPAPNPPISSLILIVFTLRNAGGATTWNMAAGYHLGPAGAPAAIDTTANYVTTIGFVGVAGAWHEAFRTVTT